MAAAAAAEAQPWGSQKPQAVCCGAPVLACMSYSRCTCSVTYLHPGHPADPYCLCACYSMTPLPVGEWLSCVQGSSRAAGQCSGAVHMNMWCPRPGPRSSALLFASLRCLLRPVTSHLPALHYSFDPSSLACPPFAAQAQHQCPCRRFPQQMHAYAGGDPKRISFQLVLWLAKPFCLRSD